MRGGLKVLTGEDLLAIFHRFELVVGGSEHSNTSTGPDTLVIPCHYREVTWGRVGGNRRSRCPYITGLAAGIKETTI